MVENVLGYALEKGHSAVDWSTRPLPEPWLRYAALDVELLVDLRDALEEELDRQGKLEWALQEFAAIAAAPPAPPRKDPWRRTSGMHKVRRRRQMAVVRELWTARDQVAQRARRLARARCSSDAAIVEAALALPAERARAGRAARLRPPDGPPPAGAVAGRRRPGPGAARARSCRSPASRCTGPPPPRAWADKDPAAAARLSAARAAVSALAEELNLPQENLITPDTVRRLCWEPPGRRRPPEAVAGASLARLTAPAPGRSSWRPPLLTDGPRRRPRRRDGADLRRPM